MHVICSFKKLQHKRKRRGKIFFLLRIYLSWQRHLNLKEKIVKLMHADLVSIQNQILKVTIMFEVLWQEIQIMWKCKTVKMIFVRIKVMRLFHWISIIKWGKIMYIRYKLKKGLIFLSMYFGLIFLISHGC